MAASGVNGGVNIDLAFAQAIRQATAVIQATPKQLAVANERAIKKTLRWLGSQMSRNLRQQLKIPQKALKPRLSFHILRKGNDKQYKLWIGTDPIAAERLGRSRQLKKGAAVGRHRFVGAFVTHQHGAHGPVRIRQQRNQTAGHTAFNDRVITGDDQHRYPLIRIGIDIDLTAIEALRRLERQVTNRFYTLLQQELNYVVNVVNVVNVKK